MHYKYALSPEQAKEMGSFLRLLSLAGAQASKAGVKPRVDLFMYAWRGLPVSEEGKRQRISDKHTERRRMKYAASKV